MIMGATVPLYTVSDLRYKTKEVFRRLKEQPVVLLQRGRPQAVLVDYQEFVAMEARQEALEAARDAFLLQRAHETAQSYVAFEELLKQHEQLFGEKLELPARPGDV